MELHPTRAAAMSDEQIVDLYWQRDERAIKETDVKYKKFLLSVALNIVHDACDSMVMQDGTSPEIKKYQIVGEVPDGNTTPIYGLFPQIINPDDVRGIIVNGVEIPVD